ncbi:MAG: deoxyribose-phosphate aldolase [Deltaproteobacteria bacterium]|nr:deoxyribose-phosphate aldolase [Deltaproteobacteria bacterium]
MDHLIEQVTEKVKEALLAQGLKGDNPNISKGLSTKNPILPYVKSNPKLGSTEHVPKKEGLNLASTIDHTLLKPEAGAKELEKLCKEALEFHFATVCVNSSNIAYVAKLLEGSSVKPIAVVGFPLGAASTSSKAFEAQEAVRCGAKEIDMVMNIGALKSRDYVLVTSDIIKVVEASKPYPVKVILETAMLTEEEKIIACVLAKISRAAFVKTSTGFGPGGATVKDVELMRRIVGPDMGVKASGGIKTTKDALAMISAGANRIGTSNGIAIVSGKGKIHGY